VAQHNVNIYTVTGQNVTLTHSLTRKVVKKNWRMLIAYFVITVGGIIASYFTSGWLSVGLSTGVAVITFLVGLRMVREVITITNNAR
jgi:hypothetical protein